MTGGVSKRVLTSVGSLQPSSWQSPSYSGGRLFPILVFAGRTDEYDTDFSPRLSLDLLALILGVNQQAELTVICQKGRRLMRTFTPIATGEPNVLSL